MKQPDQTSLRKTNWTNTNYNLIPTNYTRSNSSSFAPDNPRRSSSSSNNYSTNSNTTLVPSTSKTARLTLTSFFRSLRNIFTFSMSSFPSCRWLSIPGKVLSISSPTPLGRKVTGTLFGHRKGHVTFAVQDHPRSAPALLVELAVSTSALVREMSSGLVRIALECERGPHAPSRAGRLLLEPVWTMYCNGRKCGYATTRACTEFDWYVLNTVQSVSAGAGVIPLVEAQSGSGSEGELLYMRAKFERVVGNKDSEAFYMLNPDGTGGPELSIFLLRL